MVKSIENRIEKLEAEQEQENSWSLFGEGNNSVKAIPIDEALERAYGGDLDESSNPVELTCQEEFEELLENALMRAYGPIDDKPEGKSPGPVQLDPKRRKHKGRL